MVFHPTGMYSVLTLPGIVLGTGYAMMNSMLQSQAATGSAGDGIHTSNINGIK